LTSISLGGLISLSMVAEAPKETFKGMSLIAPCLGLSDLCAERFAKYKTMAKMISYFAPHYQYNDRKSSDVPKWLDNWASDPLYSGGSISAHNLLSLDSGLAHFH